MLFSRKRSYDLPEPAHGLRMLVDDGATLHAASALQLDGRTLLIDLEVELEPGTTVSLTTLDDEDHVVEFMELEGKVLNTFVDILVEAFADNRFFVSLELHGDESQISYLERRIAAEVNEEPKSKKVITRKKERDKHRKDLLASSFWADGEPA
jgi:hypothetical protein